MCFQYQTLPNEMRYNSTALFLYATKQLASLAVQKLNRTKPDGYNEIVVDFSDTPMSLRPSRTNNPYGTPRHGHRLWDCPNPLSTQGYRGPGANTGIDEDGIEEVEGTNEA